MWLKEKIGSSNKTMTMSTTVLIDIPLENLVMMKEQLTLMYKQK
jgi:hypothetical protein